MQFILKIFQNFEDIIAFLVLYELMFLQALTSKLHTCDKFQKIK